MTEMCAACSGAIAALGVVAPACPVHAQHKTETSLSRQSGIFSMQNHKLIAKVIATGQPSEAQTYLRAH